MEEEKIVEGSLTQLVERIVKGKVLNSLGTKDDMRIYQEQMEEATKDNMNKIDEMRIRLIQEAHNKFTR